jgi:hypothetical protein
MNALRDAKPPQALCVTIDRGDAVPCIDKRARDRRTDAAGRTRDQNDARVSRHESMIPKKLIQGGYRLSDKIMLSLKICPP